MRLRFTIRDLLWPAVLVAVCVGWLRGNRTNISSLPTNTQHTRAAVAHSLETSKMKVPVKVWVTVGIIAGIGIGTGFLTIGLLSTRHAGEPATLIAVGTTLLALQQWHRACGNHDPGSRPPAVCETLAPTTLSTLTQ